MPDRQHFVTVLGEPEPATPLPGASAGLRRRATDRLARPRVLVYLEERIEVMAEGPDGVLLDSNAARQLANALLHAADELDAR